jgi:hypothetical protein
MSDLRTVRPGEAMRAADFNAVVREVERLMLLRFPPTPEILVRCRVAAVNGSVVVSGAAPGVNLRTVTYDLQPIGKPNAARLLGVRPTIGRPWYVDAGGTAVLLGVPAAVDDPAFVIRFPDGEGAFTSMVIVPELLMVGEPCEAPGGGGGGGGGA